MNEHDWPQFQSRTARGKVTDFFDNKAGCSKIELIYKKELR